LASQEKKNREITGLSFDFFDILPSQIQIPTLSLAFISIGNDGNQSLSTALKVTTINLISNNFGTQGLVSSSRA